jgi:hypothetical protein
MAFAITPVEYLKITSEQHGDFVKDPLSLRKAIALSMFANHICEHVFAAYSNVADNKIEHCATLDDYRRRLIAQKPELGIIRDLCDFGKHGPKLERKTVQVARTEVKKTLVLDTLTFMLLGLPNHHLKEKIVVTLNDGSQRFFDGLISDVLQFWDSLFTAKSL